MIESTASIPEGLRIPAGICVVGAGPAGIALALRLAAHGVGVLLLESGGLAPSPATERLNRGEVADPALHPPPDWFRRRALGGASGIWGGRCVPLDAIDFAVRPWIAHSGWPIGPGDLAEHYVAANALCEAGEFAYQAPPDMPPIVSGFAGRHFADDRLERFSCPADFGARYRARLAASRHIHVLIGATVTEIHTDDSGQTVRALSARSMRGRRFDVLPRVAVLATGGLEVPRLLLASRGRQTCGVGNGHDLVGRFYMCHLAGNTGGFTASGASVVQHGYARDADGVYCRRRFALRAAAQRDHRLGNMAIRLHHPRIADPRHGSGALSLLYMAAPFVAREYGLRLRGGGLSDWPAHLLNTSRDAAGAARFALHWLRRRMLAARKLPGVIVPPRGGRYSLDFHAEQVPDPESRVTLGHGRDAFGTPVLRIDWRCTALDRRTLRQGVALLAADIAASGCGALRFDPDEVEADALRDGAYGGHHIGTARMAASAARGVVNADCRVHGVRNLFVAGSAVFPTSGQANPTLTIVALALRLGDHLARHPDAGAEPARGGLHCALP